MTTGRVIIVTWTPTAAPNCEVLEAAGLSTAFVTLGDGGIPALTSSKPDLVILDGRGNFWFALHLCQMIRELPGLSHLPLIIWSDAVTDDDRLRAYDAGVDEIIGRVKLALSDALKIGAIIRCRSRPRQFLSYAGLELDLQGYRARQGNRTIPLSQQQLSLLRLFIEDPERVLTRQQIARALWSRDDVAHNTVRAAVQRLRKLLRAQGGAEVIRSVKGRGWSLEQGTHSC